ncbi:MAG: peptide-methionine (S)-S-oxide reductase MsrA [Chitinophagaceae bacterium]
MRLFTNFSTVLLISVFSMACGQKQKAQSAISDASLSSVVSNGIRTDTATFGTGCFWCTEAIFQQLDGVLKVTSGYSGGRTINPTYEQVSTGKTGHAEVVQIVFDPLKVNFEQLLKVFWSTHDPTTLNKQGNDDGTQYRSVIFYHSTEQRKESEHYKLALDTSGSWPNPIVTAIEPYHNFFTAEKYHQNYYNNNGAQPYCKFVIGPKLEKFEKVFKDQLKKN